MSDLSTEVHIFLQMKGVDIKDNTDDLMTIINRGVIKAEQAARMEALSGLRKLVDGWVERGWEPSQIRQHLFDRIDKLTNQGGDGA